MFSATSTVVALLALSSSAVALFEPLGTTPNLAARSPFQSFEPLEVSGSNVLRDVMPASELDLAARDEYTPTSSFHEARSGHLPHRSLVSRTFGGVKDKYAAVRLQAALSSAKDEVTSLHAKVQTACSGGGKGGGKGSVSVSVHLKPHLEHCHKVIHDCGHHVHHIPHRSCPSHAPVNPPTVPGCSGSLAVLIQEVQSLLNTVHVHASVSADVEVKALLEHYSGLIDGALADVVAGAEIAVPGTQTITGSFCKGSLESLTTLKFSALLKLFGH